MRGRSFLMSFVYKLSHLKVLLAIKVLLLYHKPSKGDMMKRFSFLAILIIFATTMPAFAQGTLPPNPQVEAQAARALLDVEIQMKKSAVELYPGVSSLANENEVIKNIALSFARLGRTQTALQTTKLMSIKDTDVSNGAPFTREEILRLSVRRSAVLGNLKNAERLIPQIKDQNAKTDALLTLARAYLREGNKKAAHNALFEATQLLSNRFYAIIYTAYLFTRCGDDLAAKRLFARAEDILLPIHLSKDPKKAEQQQIFSAPFLMRESLRHYLLKAGFVNEWLKIRQQGPESLYSVDSNMLVKLHRTDVAIDIARKSVPGRRIDSLVEIALQIAEENPQQADQLLDEANADLQKYSTAPVDNPNPANTQEYINSLRIFLAATYKLTRKNEKAQQIMRIVTKNTSPQQTAFLQLQFVVFPSFIKKNIYHEDNFSKEELSEINTKLNIYLSRFPADKEVLGFLQGLIEMQIKAGQFNDARNNIEIIEKPALEEIQTAKNPDDFNDAIRVAGFWKEAKSPECYHKTLEKIFNSPVKIKDFDKMDRANRFITSGFVDEGLNFIASLPKDQRNPKMQFYPPIYYQLSKAHPTWFPRKMLLSNTSLREQAQALSEFISGLTYDIFRAPGEEELVLYVDNGYRSRS